MRQLAMSVCVVEALVHTCLKSTADDSEVELMQSNDEAVELMGSEDWQRRPTCRHQSVWQQRGVPNTKPQVSIDTKSQTEHPERNSTNIAH